ncbi:MAG: nucleotidyltransferase family protein, partial [Gemmatimonadota bacterium]
DGMTGRALGRELLGTRVTVLGAADQLVHVCGNAAQSPVRGSLRWVTDAWLLIESDPALDWEVVLRNAERAELALPLSVMLRYLAEELQSPIPGSVVERLDDLARSASPIARDVALYGARAGLPALALVRRVTGGLRPRLWALRWLLFPSPTYLRHAYRGRRVPVGLLYPYRIWHHTVAGVRGRLRRVRMPGSLEAEIA